MTSAKTILIHFEIFAFAFDPESCSSNPMLKEFRKTLQKQKILDVATKWWTCKRSCLRRRTTICTIWPLHQQPLWLHAVDRGNSKSQVNDAQNPSQGVHHGTC